MTTRVDVQARTGWSAKLSRGQRLRIIDAEGGQAADLFAFNANDPEEYLSAPHSRVAMEEAYPRVGWTFVTNERRPILRFVEDTSPGHHDCLAAACDRARYEQLGAPDHPSCEQNLQVEARKQGFEVRHAPQPINVFANFRVTPEGRFELRACQSEPGDAATFELLIDSIVVVSACPQDIIGFQPGGPTDLAVEVVAASDAEAPAVRQG